MECAIWKNIYRRGEAFAVNLIAHDYIAEAERPRRAEFRAPHRSVSGREPEFGDTSLIMHTAA